MTHATTVLHNNHFSRAVATTYLSPTLQTSLVRARVDAIKQLHTSQTDRDIYISLKKRRFVFNDVRDINCAEN